jgi:hypothetical protein
MAHRVSLRTLSITEILSKSLALYVARFEIFLFPFLLTSLVSNIVGQFIWGLLPNIEAPPNFTEEFTSWVLDYLVLIIPIIVVTLFISWFATTIANGIAVKTSADMLEGRHTSLGASLNLTFSRLPDLLVAGILTGGLIVLGLVLLVIPGIIVATMFSLTVQAIMLERLGTFESLKKSRKLVARGWVKTFVILFSVLIFVVAMNIIGGIIADEFAGNNNVLWLLIVSFVSALAQPLCPIALTYLYYTLSIEEAGVKLPPQPTYPAVPSVPVPMPSIRLQYQPKFCYKCGQSLPSDAVYCPRCGVNVKSA